MTYQDHNVISHALVLLSIIAFSPMRDNAQAHNALAFLRIPLKHHYTTLSSSVLIIAKNATYGMSVTI